MLLFAAQLQFLYFPLEKNRMTTERNGSYKQSKMRTFPLIPVLPSVSGSTLDEEDSPASPQMAPCCLQDRGQLQLGQGKLKERQIGLSEIVILCFLFYFGSSVCVFDFHPRTYLSHATFPFCPRLSL